LLNCLLAKHKNDKHNPFWDSAYIKLMQHVVYELSEDIKMTCTIFWSLVFQHSTRRVLTM